MNFKRLLTFLLLPSLLFSSFLVSCGTSGEKEPENGKEPPADTPEEPKRPDGLAIFDGGECRFSIRFSYKDYYANGSELKNYIDRFCSDFQTKYGVEPEKSSDRNMDAEDTETYEIVIGNTFYAETADLKKELRAGEWAVTVKGHKIVILGTSIEETQHALYWFINNPLKNASKEFFYFGEADAKYASSSFSNRVTVNGESIAAFSIVRPDPFDAVAAEVCGELCDRLAVKCGYSLPLTNASDGAEYAIKVLPSFGSGLLSSAYDIVVEGKTVTMTAGSLMAYAYMIDDFIERLTAEKTVDLKDGEIYLDLAEKKWREEGIVKTPGTLRVVYHNVYGYQGETPHLDYRAYLDTGLYTSYEADCVCLQEMSTGARDAIVPVLSAAGYTEVPAKSAGNYTPVFYRADKFDLLDKGWQLYDGPNDVNSKSFTWAKLKEKATGKIFCVISTHFMYNDKKLTAEQQNSTRVSNAKQLNEFLATLSAQGIPAVFGGDLNCVYTSDPLGTLLTAGSRHAFNVAAKADNYGTCHAYPKYNETLKYFDSYPSAAPGAYVTKAIDHILVRGDLTVTQFRVITNRFAMKTSDHCPTMIEFSI